MSFQNSVSPSPAYNGNSDTLLRQANPTSTAGASAARLEIDGDDPSGSSQDLWALVKWDVSDLPAGSTVLGASITFNAVDPGGPYSAYQVRRDWSEGEASWRQWRNGKSWQADGGHGANDRGSTPLGTFNFGTGLLSFSLNADGIALVQDWVDGVQPNYGFMLGDSASTNGLDLDSSETASPGNRPKLSITYVATDPNEFPPTVVSVETNADQQDPPNLPQGQQPTSWKQQHSELRSIVVTFSVDVNVPLDAVSLTHLGFHAPGDPDAPIALRDDQLSVNGKVLTITFGDGELEEGVYRLDIADTVTDGVGRQLDGDVDRAPGGSYQFVGAGDDPALFKIVAAWNGDAGVTVFDFPTLSYWFGRTVGSEPGMAPSYVDLNVDNGVTIFDFPLFAGNFGRGVIFPANLQDAGMDSLLFTPDRLESAADRFDQRANPLEQAVEKPVRVQWSQEHRFRDVAQRRLDRSEAKLLELEQLLDLIGEDVFRGWQAASSD
jgi:hypothetical protein